jgi:hypothetical protein
MSPWVDVDSDCYGYDREQWVIRWRRFMRHFFNIDPPYDYNGSKVSWVMFNQELRETMTTIWSLKDEGYRTSYQKHVKTFFWVDDKFYKENRREILQWAERFDCKVPSKEYGWIEIPNDKIETLFRLTWAGKSYG